MSVAELAELEGDVALKFEIENGRALDIFQIGQLFMEVFCLPKFPFNATR